MRYASSMRRSRGCGHRGRERGRGALGFAGRVALGLDSERMLRWEPAGDEQGFAKRPFSCPMPSCTQTPKRADVFWVFEPKWAARRQSSLFPLSASDCSAAFGEQTIEFVAWSWRIGLHAGRGLALSERGQVERFAPGGARLGP